MSKIKAKDHMNRWVNGLGSKKSRKKCVCVNWLYDSPISWFCMIIFNVKFTLEFSKCCQIKCKISNQNWNWTTIACLSEKRDFYIETVPIVVHILFEKAYNGIFAFINENIKKRRKKSEALIKSKSKKSIPR